MEAFDRALVTGARDAEGLARLLEALGLSLCPQPWPALPTSTPDSLASCRIAASRGGLAAVVGRGPNLSTTDVARDVRALVEATPGRRWLFVLHDAELRWLTFLSPGVDGEIRRLDVRRPSPDTAALETLAEMVAHPGDGATALALRHARALARGRVTDRFFGEFRAVRAAVARGWTGLIAPEDPSGADRDELSLLLLCRLLFLHFVEARGWLNGDTRYFVHLLERWLAAPRTGSFLRQRLEPLFFRGVNTPTALRTTGVQALGRLPFLNGGLFERRPVERRNAKADLPDATVVALFDGLFARYRFTPVESASEGDQEAGGTSIDPEMLGRVFEGLMDPRERRRSGTFYTPRGAVRALVRAALKSYLSGVAAPGAQPASAGASDAPDGSAVTLDRILAGKFRSAAERSRIAEALRSARILDPAAGSGALLLGALEALIAARRACGETVGLAESVRDSLYGVDLKPDAALLCMLRLWLALLGPGSRGNGAHPAPLPNLDRRIRQGDALVDPLEFAMAARESARQDAGSSRALRTIAGLRARYFVATGSKKRAIERALLRAERRLALAVLGAARRHCGGQVTELESLAASCDLFGQPAAGARDLARLAHARAALADVEQRRRQCLEASELPFFSFRLHFSEVFAAGGFDIIVTNPPWVRPHRWSPGSGSALRRRYALLRPDPDDCDAGHHQDTDDCDVARSPDASARRRERLHAAQADLSLAFLERSLELLRPGGTLAVLLPAKVLRSLYGGAARAMLVRRTTIVSIDDHALDQHAMFRADSFVTMLVLRKVEPPSEHRVRVRLTRRTGSPAEFSTPQALLPAPSRSGRGAPWLLVPAEVADAVRAMQRAGEPLGDQFAVHRGVFTGANDVFLLRNAEGKVGGIVRACGGAGDGASPGSRTGPSSEASGQRDTGRAASGEGGEAELYVEAEALRRAVRGSGVHPWRFDAPEHLIWLHGEGVGRAHDAPRLAAAYLERHRQRLKARNGGDRLAPGGLFRVAPAVVGPKVMWRDLGTRPGAVYAPDPVRCADGVERALVPLNTVYFIAPSDHAAGYFLAALLNSLPVAIYLRAIAERAKDARFRFLGWTLAALPIPRRWRDTPEGREIEQLSRRAHADAWLDDAVRTRLNQLAAGLYGLSPTQMAGLMEWDRWLAEAT